MSNFVWNINFLGFWRLAWLKSGFKCYEGDGWKQCGRIAATTQRKPLYYMARYWFKIV